MTRREFLLAASAIASGCGEHGAGILGTRPRTDIRAVFSPRPILGINSHGLSEGEIQLIRDLGIRHVRTTIYTQLWKDSPAYVNQMRERVARAADRGLKLLVVVHNAFGPVFRMGQCVARQSENPVTAVGPVRARRWPLTRAQVAACVMLPGYLHFTAIP
jgi:hypothetical protein